MENILAWTEEDAREERQGTRESLAYADTIVRTVHRSAFRFAYILRSNDRNNTQIADLAA